MRLARLLLVLLVALVALPATAAATTLTGTSSLVYTASAGDDDSITVQLTGTSIVFVPSGDVDRAWNAIPAGCSQDAGTHDVTCPSANTKPITFNTGDGDDTIDTSTVSASMTFTGGTGVDTFRGGSGVDNVNGGDGNDDLAGNLGGDTVNGDADDDTLDGGSGQNTLNGGAGEDAISGGPQADSVNGGDGDDRISGGDGADTLRGDAGSDNVDGGPAQDTVDGGGGRDFLNGGSEADDIRGSDGFDEVRYTDRTATTQAVTVTLDDSAGDGEAGEADNVHSDVEDIVGGAGSDHLFGADSPNVIAGGEGNDEIDGGGGADALSGEGGGDTLKARDGNAESVDCGAGNDSAVADEIDRLSACESSDIAPAAGPAAPPNLDADGDGSARPADCDDANAAVRPGAQEAPGNSVDEDCDGLANPFPSVGATVEPKFRVARSVTRFQALRVLDVPADAKVTLTCKGGGCSKALKKGYEKSFTRATRSLNLLPRVKALRLRRNAKVTVSVLKTGSIGAIFEFRTRSGRTWPAGQRRCLPPGATKAVEC